MPKGATFDNDILNFVLHGTAISGISDPLYLSLHTASPGTGGNQTTSECAYTGYARVAVARTTGGWTVSGASGTPVSTISFPACTGGTETATYAAIGTAATGTGKILYFGATGNISISSGITPQLTTASAVTES
jgi:hypothetical protein